MSLDQEKICRAFQVPPWVIGVTPVPRRFSWQRLKWWWICRPANRAASQR